MKENWLKAYVNNMSHDPSSSNKRNIFTPLFMSILWSIINSNIVSCIKHSDSLLKRIQIKWKEQNQFLEVEWISCNISTTEDFENGLRSN